MGSTRAQIGLDAIERWFTHRGHEPFDFQREAWEAYLDGRSGLIHAPTGTGKSMAAWLGPVAEALESDNQSDPAPVRVLWLTPMRALASDTVRALAESARDLGVAWTVEKRTGDTPSSAKARQRKRLPSALVTTPESLSLLLSYADSRKLLSTLRCVVVDEWHELLSTKRGTQTELALARLRAWIPELRTWGLSATIGNLDSALEALIGPGADPERTSLISADIEKPIEITSILPRSIERFPWSGHLGLALLDEAIEAVEECAGTTLMFTNTRSQTELWFKAIIGARPDWVGRVAVHHGSLDRDLRGGVEQLLKRGDLKCVVCTSSLDLGVDFQPVDQVIQVGSPKGVARLLQRAGRSGHQPGAVSRALCLPTLAFEMIEVAAASDAAARGEIEDRLPLAKPLDVLVQHLVTIASGGGFDPRALLAEIRSSAAYAGLTDEEWEWCLDFVVRGGPTLNAYPQFARVHPGEAGWSVASPAIARTHRLSIGTISSDMSMTVRMQNGASLGTIEESFIARLNPGERFVFAGRVLELVRVRDMTAHAKRATRKSNNVPKWAGGRSPLSSELAHAVRRRLSDASEGAFDGPELELIRPLLELQATLSIVPSPGQLLIEMTSGTEGHHAFVFPFEGRLVHEGVGALLAHRLAGESARSLAVTVNDYGFEILSSEALPTEAAAWRGLLSAESLLADLLDCLNSTELTRRRFRDVARVAGLLFPGYPGGKPGSTSKSARQLQASSNLFFEVFSEFDPENRLLEQAKREVLAEQLEVSRLRTALEKIDEQEIVVVPADQLTPFAFPIWAESLRTQHVSSERWSDRVRSMALKMERSADKRRKPARTTETQ